MRGTSIVSTIAGAASCLFLGGCASMVATEWGGRPIGEVIAKLGPPTWERPATGEWTAVNLPAKIKVLFSKPTGSPPAGDESVYVWDSLREPAKPMVAGSDRMPGSIWVFRRWTFVVAKDGTIRNWSVKEAFDPEGVQYSPTGPVCCDIEGKPFRH